MQIACDQCQAQYEMDPPAAPFARDQDLVFRCTSCGNSILVKRGGETASDSAPEADPDAGTATDGEASEQESRSLLMRQEGKTYHVKDQATLQRWIVERRVLREDEIATGGGEWKKVGDFEGFQVFFELIDQADRGSEDVAASSGIARPGKDLFAAPQPGVDPFPAVDQSGGAPSAPIKLAVEAIPEEEPAPLPATDHQIGPDEPTMDMSLDEEDFFSEEHTVLDDDQAAVATTLISGGDDEPGAEFEWVESRRKRILTWWLLFFSALGGLGFFALNYLNQRDVERNVADVASEPSTVEVAPEAPEAPEAATPAATDSGGAAADAAADATEATEPAVPEPAPPAAPAAAPAKPKAPAASSSSARSKPKSKSKSPAPRSSGNAKTETARGWSSVDRGDWARARTHFSNALKTSPGHTEARFGVAYVNEHPGRVEEAVRQYCRLKATADGDTKLEATGRLNALRRECP